MKKLLKSVAIVVAAVLVVALVAPYALRGKIAQIVKREANKMLVAKLDFERLNISLLRHFPNASLELRGLTLVGVDRFEGDTIVAARRISVVVSPWSLLGDDGLVVKKVLLAAPAVHGHKLADGAVNWDVMRQAEEPTEPVVEETAQPTAEEPSSFKLAMRDFRITDAVIRYEDDSTKMAFSTRPLDLRLRGDFSAAESELDLRLAMQQMHLRSGVVTLLSDAELELNALVAADLAHNYFRFAKNTLRLNAIEMSLDGWAHLLEDGAVAMDLRAGTEQVQFKEVLSLIPAFYTREFRNLTAGGELSLAMWVKGEMRDAVLPAFELKAEVQDGRFQYASLPKAVTDINIAARVANPGGVMDKTEVELSKFGLKMADNTVAATFYGTHLISNPTLRASLRGDVNLGSIKEVYPLEEMELAGQITADLKLGGCRADLEQQRYDRLTAAGTFVVEKMALSMAQLPPVQLHRAAATISPSAMTLGELRLQVGGSDVAANGQLTNYLGYLMQGSMLSGRLYVNSELLDLNELMTSMASEEHAEVEQENAVDTVADGETQAMAVAIPANLDLSLSTHLERILFQQMDIKEVVGEVSLAQEALSLNKLAMQLFGGSATASGVYSTAENPSAPKINVDLGLKQASFEQTFAQLDMVKSMVPLFAKTGGNYSLKMDLRSMLDETMSPDMQSVNATGELTSANIRLQNIAVLDKLATALHNDKLKAIEAENVLIKFVIRDGKLTTQPFDLKMGSTKLTLGGTTGLDQTIDYTMQVALPEGAAKGRLSTINAQIGGTFSDPKIQLGVQEAAEEVAKSVIDEQVQKLTGSETLSEEVAKQAERLRKEAAEAGAKLVKAAEEKRAELIEEGAKKGQLAELAAQTVGDKLVAEAEKQAAALTAKAEEQIAKLTAPKEE